MHGINGIIYIISHYSPLFEQFVQSRPTNKWLLLRKRTSLQIQRAFIGRGRVSRVARLLQISRCTVFKTNAVSIRGVELRRELSLEIHGKHWPA